ncbi:MAG: putative baseplate assembly protein [Polaromonas sp.]
MKYFCCDPRRLAVIGRTGSANGIEFLEVRDHLEPIQPLRQRTLFMRLLRTVPLKANGDCALAPEDVLIDGGERIAIVPVEWVAAADKLPAGVDPALVNGMAIGDLPRMLVIRTTLAGDFSRYTLHLRQSPGSGQPDGFDPKLSAVEFSFKVECPSDFDCAAPLPCPPPVSLKPDIDYLAKDYTGFRRLMLDRLNLLAPGWSERSAADVGVALVEMLAYAADNLSYRQDAIAAEAYLTTARQRVSVRRHARLVDYALHDGCNARAWVQVKVTANYTLPQGTPLLTRSGRLPPVLAPGSKELSDALAAGAVVFETAHEVQLQASLNDFSFYTWGDQACCLPRGATRATLRGAHPELKPNHVLVFQEVLSPTTLRKEDADPARRWAVRLVGVKVGVDPSGRLFDEPPLDAPQDVTEIAWDAADALPFALCLSIKDQPGVDISIALGNIVLADHGQTVRGEALGSVPQSHLKRVAAASMAGPCRHAEAEPIPPRFRPALRNAPLTQGFDLAKELATPLALDPGLDALPLQLQDEGWWTASALIDRDPHDALPRIDKLEGQLKSATGTLTSFWTVQRDLLGSSPVARDFVAETGNDGAAFLRFGDGVHGERPREGTSFTARYRVGNGVAGNVGAQTIFHIVSSSAGIFGAITNPMAAAGGIEPEDLEAARRDAPEAFQTQERAVTAADYAAAAERRPDIQRAAATFRWTGSWHTVFVSADRLEGAAVDARFEARLRAHLERFRMAGHDLEVNAARYVALDITLHVCVLPGYFRSAVLRAVQRELGAGRLPDGRLAAFHPDNFTFGQPVYLSRIVAAAQAVQGVEAVWVKKFERFGQPDTLPMEAGMLPLGRLEIAQLANNPNFRERGRLTLEAGGGQ